jgi:hypothetical protein
VGAVASEEMLPLFPERLPERGAGSLRAAIEVIDRDLAVWEGLVRRAAVDPELAGLRKRLADLSRDLRSLRDCALAASHPRVRQALLHEAGAVTRRMKALGSRLRVRGLDVLRAG